MEIITDINGIEHVIIEHEEGGFTSMPKSVYDEMTAKTEQPTGWVEPQLTKE